MSEQELTLPDCVSRVTVNGREVFLVGTAHVSKESVEDVRRTIEAVKPDAICIELCQSRFKALTQQEDFVKMDIFKIIKQKKAVFFLAQLIMHAFYRRLGEKLGVIPGAEMLEVIKLAQQTKTELVLADREIEITLKRVWRYLGFWNKLRMVLRLALEICVGEKISEELIEKLKTKDQLEAVMGEFAKAFPEVKRRLLDERDIYLAHKISHAGHRAVVAVVGAGHVLGIEKNLRRDISVQELMEIPPKSVGPALIKWGIPAVIIVLIAYGFFKNGAAHSVGNIYIWVLVNGLLSAAGAALALAHPAAIAAAFFGAPITSLNPLIAAGWVAGLVQAWLRKPTVADFEALPDATATVKGFWMNPVTKILLVVALANLGSVLGTWIAGTWIAARSI